MSCYWLFWCFYHMFAYFFQEKHIFKTQDLSSEKVRINHEGQALGRFIHQIQRSQVTS